MSKIIVARNQQAEMARLHPKPVYSRILSLKILAPADGAARFATTRRFGQSVWLLNIKIWMTPRVISYVPRTTFGVYTGTNEIKSADEMLKWENLLPLYGENRVLTEWSVIDGYGIFEWSMMRYFEGEPRRFGIRVTRTDTADELILASFEISEG